MSELRSLYQEVILDHYKRPRNFGKLDEEGVRQVEGYNPLCGDQITVFLDVEGGRIQKVRFEGVGCAISTASASLMTEAVEGKTVEEARELFDRVHHMVTEEGKEPDEALEGELGKLEALSGVREYPVRIKCATLAWHALKAALEDREDTVTTE
jgi:nitrogen fixation NifU-like protein